MYIREIRQRLQEKFGINKFVEEIRTDEIVIEEEKNKGKGKKEGTLQRVTIQNIPFDEDNYPFIWRINLEKEVQGLSPIANKTTEIALAVFRIKKEKKILNVYLVEMKSKLDDKVLENIIKKFADTISRFYFLLILNDNHETEEFKNAQIRFAGLIFYNGNQNVNNDDTDITRAFHASNQKGKIECDNILELTKIPIQFFKNFDSTTQSITVSFTELEKIWQ